MIGGGEYLSQDREGARMAIFGHTLIIIGFLLTMTFVGAIVGLPILALGVGLCFVSNMRKKRNARVDRETTPNV